MIASAIATDASVEPGPTGVSGKPSSRQSASPTGVQRSITISASSMSRAPTSGSASPAFDCAIDVTAITGRPLFRAPRANSTTTAPRPLAENTITESFGANRKLARMTSARPGTRSMNIAWRWPLAPTTWVWKVIDSSTMGWKPG